jgi:hypothetical protein
VREGSEDLTVEGRQRRVNWRGSNKDLLGQFHEKRMGFFLGAPTTKNTVETIKENCLLFNKISKTVKLVPQSEATSFNKKATLFGKVPLQFVNWVRYETSIMECCSCLMNIKIGTKLFFGVSYTIYPRLLSAKVVAAEHCVLRNTVCFLV